MYRKSGLVTLIVFVLSFFLYPFIATANDPDDLQNKQTLMNNASDKMEIAVGVYNDIKSAMETLNGNFDSNQQKIAQSLDVTLKISGGAIVSAVVALGSAGSLTPAAFAAVLAAATGTEAAAVEVSGQALVDSMGTVSGYLSPALSDVGTKYSTYSSCYSDYIEMWADHSLVRFNNGTKSSVYTKGNLEISVNSGLDGGYYHSSASSPSDSDHAIRIKKTYKHWKIKPLASPYNWTTVDLEYKYKCKGSCSVKFTSPYDAWSSHRQKCGLPETKTVTHLADYNARMALLAIRTVAQGCGETWYTCDSDAAQQAAWHQVRTCVKDYTNSSGVKAPCGVRFIRCLGHTRDHNESDQKRTKTLHSDVADSSSPVVSLTPPPTPTDGTPNCPDCTSHCSSPCSCTNSGTCNGTVSYHACGVHETTVSGDHSLQASCSSTDANGNSCTVTNFYACDNHSHVYPTPPTPPTPPPPSSVVCGAARWTGCTTPVSSRTQHKVESCSGCGSTYWTCNPDAVAKHETKHTCSREGCGASYTRCTKADGTCSGGRYVQHKS